MNTSAIIWFSLFVLFLIIEGQVVALVSIWFAAGALVATVASVLGAEIWLQITLFFVVSIGFMLALRPMLRKYVTPKIVKTNVDAMIGTKGYVTADIDNIASTGQVKLGGMEWTARSTSGDVIKVGTLVTVDKIEGVKAFVTPVAVQEKVSL